MKISRILSSWRALPSRWEWAAATILSCAVLWLAVETFFNPSPASHKIPIQIAVNSLSNCIEAKPGLVQEACVSDARALSQSLHVMYINELPVTPRVSRFNVFVVGRTLAYRRSRCDEADIPAVVTVNVYARDPSDLPEDRREQGFVSEDFKFADRGVQVDGACVAVKTLPDWPVSKLVTGEYVQGQGFRWSLGISF